MDAQKVDTHEPAAVGDDDAEDDHEEVERLPRLELPVVVVLAEKQMTLESILGLGRDSVISFEKLHNEPLEIYADNRLVGAGKAVEVGEKFGIHITRVDRPEEALRKLGHIE